METAARAEAEAQLEEAASARDEALARLGSLERSAASLRRRQGSRRDGGGGGQGRPRAERGETRAKAEQDLVSASSESEQAARALSMLQDKVSALTDELYTARSKTEAAERRVRQLDNGMSELISNISDERDLYANVLKERERLAGLLDDAESELSRRSSLADRLSEELQAAESARRKRRTPPRRPPSTRSPWRRILSMPGAFERARDSARRREGEGRYGRGRGRSSRAALAELAGVKAKRLRGRRRVAGGSAAHRRAAEGVAGNVVQTGSGRWLSGTSTPTRPSRRWQPGPNP